MLLQGSHGGLPTRCCLQESSRASKDSVSWRGCTIGGAVGRPSVLLETVRHSHHPLRGSRVCTDISLSMSSCGYFFILLSLLSSPFSCDVRAIEAAIHGRQWNKAVQIIQHQDTEVSAPFFKQIADHYKSVKNYQVSPCTSHAHVQYKY